ncbi:hypothetical protein H8356DRAFT_1344557 [Neocallimastix lanati (nom. inval.)]|nr:hypothetical protein H8356DRAFT_1344557 [Neocallimastix sp. JGI-2020a]
MIRNSSEPEEGKAYEYLSEFNLLRGILQLSDETKILLLVQYNRERKIAIIDVLGMINSRRPSKDIEDKRKRNRDFNRRDSTKQNNYYKNKRDNNNHNGSKDDGTRQSERQNYYKDFYTSSNNPTLKRVLLMLNGSEYKEFVPEAKISNFRTQEELKNLNVLYNTGLQINMIHPQLAKEMGFKIENPDTARIGRVPDKSQADEAMSRTIILDVDSLGECEGDNIYIVQVQEDENTAVKKEIQLTAKITKIINLVIDNQKLKDTKNRIYVRLLHYLVDYDRWADWFKAQKDKI